MSEEAVDHSNDSFNGDRPACEEPDKEQYEEVIIHNYPDCDFCKKDCEDGAKTPRKAKYDGKTTLGAWTYMCQEHFDVHGVGLGLGRGQRLLVLR